MECLIKIYYGRIKLQDTIKATVTKEWIVVDADGHNGIVLLKSRYDFER
jgi:hypothetical protein